MRGAGRSPIPYVSNEDRTLPKEEQTIVWIRPKNTRIGAHVSRKYTAAFGNSVEDGSYDPESWYEAMLEDFSSIVVRIDNYAFSNEYIESHSEIKESINDNGFYSKPILDPEMIRDVAEDVTDGFVQEVVNVAGSRVRLNVGAKKNLNWSPSLQSGDPLPPLDGAPTNVKSA